MASAAAFALTLVGGILILIQGVIMVALGAAASGVLSAIPGFGAVLGALSAVVIIFGIIVLVGSWMIRKGSRTTGGILALIFSIIGLFLGGGFIIGSILGLVGGILAVAQK